MNLIDPRLGHRRVQLRNARMRYYWRVAAEYRAQGLNTRGRAPRKVANRPEVAHLHGRQRKAALQRLYRGVHNIPPVESRWRALRADMVVPETADFLSSLERGES